MATDFYHTELTNDFDRWAKLINEERGDFSGCKVGPLDVLRAHYTIVDYFLEMKDDALAVGGIGPKDVGLLLSAVSRQQAGFGGVNKWKDDYQLAATLTYGLVKDHAFHDCNKRTALLCCLYFMQIIGQVPSVGQREYEKLMVLIADNKLSTIKSKYHVRSGDDFEVRVIAEFLRRSTRKSDKRQYLVTFNELQKILSRFSVSLDSPKGNFIDVVRIEEKSTLFGLRRRSIKTKLATIGFPGWTRTVYHKDIEIVRKATGLTPDKGCDSKVFFHGLDPLKTLVNDYSGPLRRLANK